MTKSRSNRTYSKYAHPGETNPAWKPSMEIGSTFNMLTVIANGWRYSPAPSLISAGRLRGPRGVYVQCTCGVVIITGESSLRTGNTKSCGCLKSRRRPEMSDLFKEATRSLKAGNYKMANVSYDGAHRRIYRLHGKASDWPCSNNACNSRAKQWAYCYDSVKELSELGPESTYYLRYSPDPNDYVPLCMSCHRLFDKSNSDSDDKNNSDRRVTYPPETETHEPPPARDDHEQIDERVGPKPKD